MAAHRLLAFDEVILAGRSRSPISVNDVAILARHHRLEVGRQCYLRPATASANDDWPRRGGQAA